jgi:hypothetical protein
MTIIGWIWTLLKEACFSLLQLLASVFIAMTIITGIWAWVSSLPLA